MRDNILVTGGSDGSVRVWSLTEYQPIHRLAAHDNSVTSLQFDDVRIVSGGSDGRVKVWDLKKGTLVRELSQPADAVWRVVFEEEKAVIMASRNQKTVMEVGLSMHSLFVQLLIDPQVWSFSPPEDELVDEFGRSASPVSMPDNAMSEYGDGTPQHLAASERPISTVSEDISMADVYDPTFDRRDERSFTREPDVNIPENK